MVIANNTYTGRGHGSSAYPCWLFILVSGYLVTCFRCTRRLKFGAQRAPEAVGLGRGQVLSGFAGVVASASASLRSFFSARRRCSNTVGLLTSNAAAISSTVTPRSQS